MSAQEVLLLNIFVEKFSMLQQFILWSTGGRNMQTIERNQALHFMLIIHLVLYPNNILQPRLIAL